MVILKSLLFFHPREERVRREVEEELRQEEAQFLRGSCGSLGRLNPNSCMLYFFAWVVHKMDMKSSPTTGLSRPKLTARNTCAFV